MSEIKKQNDALLIAAVAGCVIAGTAAIALFSGIAAERDAESSAPDTSERLVRPVERDDAGTVLPASLPVERPIEVSTPAIETDIESLEPEPASEPTPACAVGEGETWTKAGMAAWDARDYERAQDCFNRADETVPDRAWVVYMRGLALWKVGRHGEADSELSRALDLDPDCVKCAVNLSRVRNDDGRFSAALEAAERSRMIDPDGAEPRFLVGRSLRNLGRTTEAVEALRSAIDVDPGHGYAHNLLGLILLETDRELEARPELEIARDLLPDVAFVRNNLGMAYERCGDRTAAVREYRVAVDLAGPDGTAASNLARIDPDGSIEASILVAASSIDVAPETPIAKTPETVVEVAGLPERAESVDDGATDTDHEDP